MVVQITARRNLRAPLSCGVFPDSNIGEGSGMDLGICGVYCGSMDFAPENWTIPETSLKLGDRLLLMSEGEGREGEVVALTSSGLARVQLSDGTLTSVPIASNPPGRVLRLRIR
jgi:hypothetical protein